jgi:hypothetical protein
VAACGGGQPLESAADPGPDASVTLFPGGDLPCGSDADCPEHSQCRVVRVGELSRQMCVAQSTPLPDGGPVLDGSAPRGVGDGGAATAFDANVTLTPYSDAGLVLPPDASDAGGVCSKSLTVTITQPGPSTCVYDSKVVETSPASLQYQCAGGAASATFGAQTFVGTLADGTLTITNFSRYPFKVLTVTCWYTAKQVITGKLASGALQYSYVEALDSGQSPLCVLTTAPCEQGGTVSVK